MKKNKMMRIASVLLVAVLLSTCAISGTFAKYVTQVSGNDSARVAKWGIKSNLDDISTFSASYYATAEVKSANGTDKVVAPGTSDSGTYKISGAPEVAYTVTFHTPTTVTETDIFLAPGKYDCKDNAGPREVTATTGKTNYYPLKWTVTLVAENATVSGTNAIDKGSKSYDTLAEAMAAITNTTLTYEANEECGLILTIAWSWAFGNQDDDGDTILGNLANNVAVYDDNSEPIANTEYSTEVKYDLAITITQVEPQEQSQAQPVE